MKNRLGFIALVMGLIALAAIVAFLHSKLSEIDISRPDAPRSAPRPLAEEVLIEQDQQQDPDISQETSIPDLVKTAEETISPRKAELSTHEVSPDDSSATDDVREEIPAARGKLPQIPVIRQTPPVVIPASPQPAAGLAASAVIIKTSGPVNVTRNGRRMPVQSGFELEQNDRIATATGSRARIRFNDGTVLSLGENTEISIDEYVYAPDNPEECSLGFRFMRGMGRMITGAITRIRPESLNVRTQMATIGIRGCDVAVHTSSDRVDVYIIDLPPGHEVDVQATVDGRPVMNMLTGDELVVPAGRRDQRTVQESLRIVSVVRGAGMTSRPMTGRDMQQIESQIEPLQPARYLFFPTADGAVLELLPEKPE